jgi:hypothetical protein
MTLLFLTVITLSQMVSELNLLYSENTLRFEYAATSYINEEANEFQTFLENYDEKMDRME